MFKTAPYLLERIQWISKHGFRSLESEQLEAGDCGLFYTLFIFLFPGPNSSSAGEGDLNEWMEFPHCFVNLLSFNSDFKMLYRYFCLFKFSVGAAVFMEYILGVSYNAKCFTCNQISQKPYKVNTIITLVLRMRKLKSRVVSMWDHWGLNSVCGL